MKTLQIIFLYAFICVSTIATAQTPYSKDLENRAKKGDVEAMATLGDAYFNGIGVKKDFNESI